MWNRRNFWFLLLCRVFFEGNGGIGDVVGTLELAVRNQYPTGDQSYENQGGSDQVLRLLPPAGCAWSLAMWTLWCALFVIHPESRSWYGSGNERETTFADVRTG